MSEHLCDIGLNLTSKQFAHDRDVVVERAFAAGVRHMMVTGLTAALSQEALALVRGRPGVLRSTAGVHPHNAKTYDRHTSDELRALARNPEVAAVGECGLDYDRDFSPRDQQRRAFEAQLELAVELGKPVFLHERKSHDDFVRILGNVSSRLAGGVVHCFTGTAAELERYLELGLSVGITGFICDERRGTHLREVVKRVPEGRLLVETDAPFLLPRDLPGATGKRNEPAFLPHVAAAVARARGEPESELWRHTSLTAARLFGLGAETPPG
ncbi:MAG TPA: TatD family hydrolase [Polyangiaceae bacterium]